MVVNKEPYRSDEPWKVDDDGVQYDTNHFVRNGIFLDAKRRSEHGHIRIKLARAQELSNYHNGYEYTPNSGELPRDGDYYILEEEWEQSSDFRNVVAAIPAEMVDLEGPNHEEFDNQVLAAQRNLHDAFYLIRDARRKLGRSCVNRKVALTTVHADLATVLRSLDDSRVPWEEKYGPTDWRDNSPPRDGFRERICELIENNRFINLGADIGIDGRID